MSWDIGFWMCIKIGGGDDFLWLANVKSIKNVSISKFLEFCIFSLETFLVLILHSSFSNFAWTIGCLQWNNQLSNLICNHITENGYTTDCSNSSLHTCKYWVIYQGIGENCINAKLSTLHYQPEKKLLKSLADAQ